MSTTVQQMGRISFTNHLMFNAVLTENESLCIRLIEAVIGRRVESVKYLDDEHEIQPEIDSHGARLDILALVDGEYVDIEMQVGREPDIERRCRFYHGAIAARFTPKGVGYADVPRSYVIFICLSDPLGAGLSRYELATACTNSPSVQVDDGATTIILNASAYEQERNPEIAGMLEYAMTGRSSGGLAQDIASAVEMKNLDRRWVRASMGIMTYEHEFEVLNRELERRAAQVEAMRAELDATTCEREAVRAELDATTCERDAMRAELDAAATRTAAIQQLSKALYAQGRIDEYFAALDDPELMDALLAELR